MMGISHPDCFTAWIFFSNRVKNSSRLSDCSPESIHTQSYGPIILCGSENVRMNERALF